MRFNDLLMAAAQGGGLTLDSDVVTWAAQVVTNGGTVSAGRTALVSSFVAALKAGSAWTPVDDILLLTAENATQQLTSLKQRRLATAVGAPAFVADVGQAFNGVDQYINTGFIPSTHAVALAANDMRLAAYERTNVGSTTYAAGTFDTTNKEMRLDPRNAGNRIASTLNSTLTAGTTVVSDSRGLTASSRTAAGVWTHWKNGSSLETIAPANAAVMPTRALYIGCYNNAGTAAGFRASTIGLVAVGASMTSGQELAFYNAVQALMTTLGANV